MKTRSILLGLALGLGIACQGLAAGEFQRIAVRDYRDKMKAGWIGQIAGVAWVVRRSSSGRTRSYRRTKCPSGARR